MVNLISYKTPKKMIFFLQWKLNLINVFLFFKLLPFRIKWQHARLCESFVPQALVALTYHSPFFSNFLFTNLFSIKFLYFFIISSLFPYFNLYVSIFIQSYVNIKLHVSTLIDTNNPHLYRVDTCNLMLT